MEAKAIKNVVEAALLSAGRALTVDQLLQIFDLEQAPNQDAIIQVIACLNAEYADRGLEIKPVVSGYRLQVKKEMAPWISRLWEEKPTRYSSALLETLALIAYRQPVTRGDIESVRGVSLSSNIIKTLREREWVRVLGHRDVPGRPAVYGTTQEFLDDFNLTSLDQLPDMPNCPDQRQADFEQAISDEVVDEHSNISTAHTEIPDQVKQMQKNNTSMPDG